MLEVRAFWRAVLAQDAQGMRAFLAPDAWVEWPCTNEHFTAEEYIRANCEYPGDWEGEIERLEELPDQVITAVRVYPKDRSASFHAVSFAKIQNGQICSLVEYWGDDGPAPAWRQEMNIGRPIGETNHESHFGNGGA